MSTARAFGILLITLSPGVSAHLLNTGLGPVIDGAVHPFVTGSELMLLIGVTLLAAQQLAAQSRWLLLIVPASFVVGVGLQFVTGISPFSNPMILSLTLIGIGLLIAARPRLPSRAVSALSGVVFLLSGLEANAAANNALVLIGNLGALFASLSVGLAICLAVDRGWGTVALRAIGSWLTAAALLLLGWAPILAGSGFS